MRQRWRRTSCYGNESCQERDDLLSAHDLNKGSIIGYVRCYSFFTFRRILQNWDSKLSDLAFTSCCCSSNLKLELLWSGGERELQLWQCLPIVKVKVNFIFRLNRMEKPKGESALSFKLGVTLCTSPLLRMIKVTNTRQTNKPPTCLHIWKTWSSNLPVFIPGTFWGHGFHFF